MVFHKIPHFLQPFAKNLKTLKQGSLLEKLQVFAKSMKFYGFSDKPTLFAIFAKHLMKTLKHDRLPVKLLVLAKAIISHGFSPNPTLFASYV